MATITPPKVIGIDKQKTTTSVITAAIDPDTDVRKIVLDVVKGKKLDTNITESIIDARVRETMSGAPTFTLSVHDPELKLLRSDVLFKYDKDGDPELREINVAVDRRPFQLVKVAWSPSSQGAGLDLSLTFEHLIVAYARRYDKKRKMNRKKTTLVQFIRSLVREIKEVDIRFISHELKTQNIAKAEKTKDQKDEDKDEGFASGETIKVKGQSASPAQRARMEAVFSNGLDMGASRKVLVIANMTVTQEAGWETSATNGVHVGLFQQNRAMGWPATRDPVTDSTAFFKRAIALDKANPSMGYADLAEAVQRSGQGSLYAQWKDEAESNVAAFTGTGSGSFSRSVPKRYNYTRGVDGKPENTWDCAQRYAELVNYRSFITGRNTWYFDSEPKLFAQRPRAIIKEDNPAVLEVTGDIDVGKKVQTLNVRVLTQMWTTPAGAVVVVKGYGPADGRWLVEDYERSLYSQEGTITLKKPTKPKPEPAPESRQITSGGDGDIDLGNASGAFAEAYAAADAIDKRNYPYKWGGGHDPGFTPPYDCSGGVSAVLHAAGLLDAPRVSGGFETYGKPGRGMITIYANDVHVFMSFWVNGQERFWGTSKENPGGGAGWHSARSGAGFVIRSLGTR